MLLGAAFLTFGLGFLQEFVGPPAPPELLALAAIDAAPPIPDRSAPTQEPHPVGRQDGVEAALRAFAHQGIAIDLERGRLELQGRICQLYEPLEYLLITQPRGKKHESLLSVDRLNAEALNAALLLLGVEAGQNVRYEAKEPPPTEEEYRNGVMPYKVFPAEGDGFYLYVGWEKELGEGRTETRFYRAEDLVLNVRAERTYQRGRFVYLGSRFVRPHKDARELFAAQAEGNLISLVYFDPPNHLMTGADPEADNQHIWYPNLYLLPEQGHPVRILFSREPLEVIPAPLGAEGRSSSE